MGTTHQPRTYAGDVTRRVLIPLMVTLSLVLSQLVVIGVGPAHAASPSLSLEQCANGARSGPRLPCQFDAPNNRWVTGALNKNNSQYSEDDAVAFRYVMDDLTVGETYTVYTNWDLIQKENVAYDYLVGWNHSEFANVGGPGGNGPPTDTTPIPDDPRVNNDTRFSGDQSRTGTQGGPRAFAAWGATLSPVSSSDYFWSDGASASADFPASTTKAILPLTFTAESSSVIIAFGGHISARFDWALDTAAGISGSSYHMRLNNEGDSSQRGLRDSAGNAVVTGQRDVQLQANAVELLPSLDIAKSVDGGASTTIAPGGSATYQITVTNGGNASATGVTVTDVLDLGDGAFTVTSVSPSQGNCSPAAGDLGHGDTLTCDLGSIAASSSATVDITLEAAAADSCGSVTNTASVTSNEEPDAKTSGTVTITVEGCDPDLDITKTVDGGDSTSVAPGGSFTYVLTVTNDGGATATAENVVVTDTLDLGGSTLSVSSVTPSQGSCSPAQIDDGTELSCSVGDLAPGDSATITLEIDVAEVDSCGAVANVASAVADNHPSVTSNTVDVDVEGCFADLSITKLASAQTVSIDGGVLTYTVTAANDATATATAESVTIVDDLAPLWDLSQVTASYSLDGGSPVDCALAGSIVTCGPEDLAPGSSMVATIAVVASPDGVEPVDGTKCGTVDNTAELHLDGVFEDEASADGIDVTGCHPDLSFEKTVDQDTLTVGADDTVTYTLTATNDADATASATVSVFDKVPHVFEIVSVTSSPADACFSIDQDVSCTDVLLDPGDSLIVTIEVALAGGPDASQCGEWTNSAQLFDGQEPVDSDSVLVTVEGCDPDIALVKTAAALLDADGLVLDEVVLLDPDGPKQLLVSVHGTDAVEITYLFEVTNTGNVFLYDVEVDDPLLGGPITLSATTLAPGESATGTATYTLDRDLDVEAGEVLNLATATATTDDDDEVSDTDDERVEIVTVDTGIAVDKTVDVPLGDDGLRVIELDEGETTTLTYTYVVTNIGTDVLTDLTLVDDKLPDVDLTAALNAAAAEAYPELAAELGAPALPPGGEVKVTAVYQITAADVAAGQVTNVALASGVGEQSGEQVEDDDTVTVDIVEVLDVVIVPEPEPEPEPAVEARTLPRTGVDGEQLLAIGILLAALGAATLLFTPRRRRLTA